jgi:GR25 family glycosyltransferase involved in LPS biosynthesis
MKNQGINNFDIVYFINLEHRTDRREHITNELSKTNIEPSKINRINGICVKDFGILGCAKSHLQTLTKFMQTPDEIQNCIIFEDDFMFSQSQDNVNLLIDLFFEYVPNFDVLMLSSNTLIETETNHPFITKIIDAQTMSGYCVSKKFAPILMDNFQKSILILDLIGHPEHEYCFDIYMKQLQPYSSWYCLNPKIGKQMESYSDIENKVVAYDC